MDHTYLSLTIMAAGAIIYYIAGHDDARVSRIAELARIMFAMGLLAFLLGK